MTKSIVTNKFNSLFKEFLTETDLPKLRDIKIKIINLLNSLPFSESDKLGLKMESELLDNTTSIYIENNLDLTAKKLLVGDFQRIQIFVSLALLEE